MSIPTATPWHKESYDLLVYDRLPKLLGERLPLAGYQAFAEGATEDNHTTCRQDDKHRLFGDGGGEPGIEMIRNLWQFFAHRFQQI